MIVVILTALTAVGAAAKLDQSYLPHATYRLPAANGQKHFGSSYQHDQYRVGPEYWLKPQTARGSSSTYSQASSQISPLRNKPGVTAQHLQFRSSGSKFGQISQTLSAGSIKASFGKKPISSSYQQKQSGSAGFEFGQNSQSSRSARSVPTTAKPGYGIVEAVQEEGDKGEREDLIVGGVATRKLLAQFPPAGHHQSDKKRER